MPNNLRAEIIAEARTWIGTPFHHQASRKHAGVDCGQLVIAVGHALGICEPMPVRNYGRLPNPRRMLAEIERRIDRITTPPQAGDILWVALRQGMPMHLMIIADPARNTVIHAYEPAGRVVETIMPFAPTLIDSAWAYRGVG